jgi:hypothetical protein
MNFDCPADHMSRALLPIYVLRGDRLPCAGPVHTPAAEVSAFFEHGGRQKTPAYLLSELVPGHIVEGPALLIDNTSTIVVRLRTQDWCNIVCALALWIKLQQLQWWF